MSSSEGNSVFFELEKISYHRSRRNALADIFENVDEGLVYLLGVETSSHPAAQPRPTSPDSGDCGSDPSLTRSDDSCDHATSSIHPGPCPAVKDLTHSSPCRCLSSCEVSLNSMTLVNSLEVVGGDACDRSARINISNSSSSNNNNSFSGSGSRTLSSNCEQHAIVMKLVDSLDTGDSSLCSSPDVLAPRHALADFCHAASTSATMTTTATPEEKTKKTQAMRNHSDQTDSLRPRSAFHPEECAKRSLVF